MSSHGTMRGEFGYDVGVPGGDDYGRETCPTTTKQLLSSSPEELPRATRASSGAAQKLSNTCRRLAQRDERRPKAGPNWPSCATPRPNWVIVGEMSTDVGRSVSAGVGRNWPIVVRVWQMVQHRPDLADFDKLWPNIDRARAVFWLMLDDGGRMRPKFDQS